MCINEETAGLTRNKDVIFSGGIVLLVQTACLYSIYHDSPLVTIWAGNSGPAGMSTTL